MFFLPTSTDAPIYHRPITTSLLCIANVAIFCNECNRHFCIDGHPWVLAFGDGYHPTQWLLSNFLHANPLHLVVNLYFLFLFGHVVEGKIGWWKLAIIYLIACLAEGFVTQTFMLWSAGGGALGASGAIFALMAICVIWAPKTELECMFFAFGTGVPVRPSTIQIQMGVFCLGYITWNFMIALVLTRFVGMSSEFLHMVGACIGLPIGIVMLKRGWVDCDNWDLFSVIAGRHESSAGLVEETTSQTLRAEQQEHQRSLSDEWVHQIQEMIRQQEWKFAFGAWKRACEELVGFTLPDAAMLQLLWHFDEVQDRQRAIVLMKQFLTDHEDGGYEVRMALARNLLLTRQQPALAHRLLKEVRDLEMDPADRRLWRKLIRVAASRRDELELSDELV